MNTRMLLVVAAVLVTAAAPHLLSRSAQADLVAQAASPAQQAYCTAAVAADDAIGAELHDFDPNTATPDDLKRLFDIAVPQMRTVAAAAPAEITADVAVLAQRWANLKVTFADVRYVWADLPAGVMTLDAQEQEAFDTVAAYNDSFCSLSEPGTGHTADDGHTDHNH